MTVTHSRTDPAKLLWVDDQIASFDAHIEDLEENGYEVVAVATADEAMSTIRRGGHFDAILVDLKMPDADGIELLKALYEEVAESASTRVIVLSSFLYDRAIRRRLVDLNMNVALLEKTRTQTEGERESPSSLAERLSEVLSRSEQAPAKVQFSTWDRAASNQDPFEISLEAYLDSPLVVRLQIDRKAQKATAPARRELSKSGIVWSLFCGSSTEPIKTATDLSDVPSDEQIFDLASREGHPPYEFYEQGEFEEWTASDLDDDHDAVSDDGCPGAPDYPYFRIAVAQRRGDEISTINLARDFHFDSGLDMTAFDLTAALQIGLDVETDKPAKSIGYGGRRLLFYTVSGDAFVERGSSGSMQVTIAGRAYLDWSTAPFSRLCAEFGCTASELCYRRHALLGRNLLVDNALSLDLRRMHSPGN